MAFKDNFTVLEVACATGISSSTIYNRIRTGEVHCVEFPCFTRYGNTIKTIHVDDISKIAEAAGQKATAKTHRKKYSTKTGGCDKKKVKN